jgi:hypothetical protein
MTRLARKGLFGGVGLVLAVALQRLVAPTWLFFLTAAVLAVLWVTWDWFFSSGARKWGLAGGALTYLGLIAVMWWPVSESPTVSITCVPITIPMRGKNEDALYAVYLDPKWGNQLVTTSSTAWPLWATANELAYTCEVTNNGRSALQSLSVSFLATFHTGGALPSNREIAVTYPIPLKAHSAAVFHVADDTKQVLEVSLPETVSARVGDDEELLKLRVHYATIGGSPLKLRGFNP